MEQLSPSQLRAARGLLDWSRADLAQKTGISEPTLHRFENGQGEANARTQAQVRGALENAGIDFTAHQGVRFRPEGMEVLQGDDGIGKFFDQVYAHALRGGGLIRQNGIEDRLMFASAPLASQRQKTRMEALKHERKNIIVRVLVQEGVVDFQCPDYAEYKWFARNAPMPVPYYMFGDSVGIFASEGNKRLRVYQITSPVIAAAYARQFDSAWKMANSPGQGRRASQRLD